MHPGQRLPSTKSLAAELQVSHLRLRSSGNAVDQRKRLQMFGEDRCELHLTSNEAGNQLRKRQHQNHDNNSGPEEHEASGAPFYTGSPEIELY
jgi:DNA-binding transcriptional MocR family regulator